MNLTFSAGEDCFENANEFVPERWTTHREMVRNIAAYNPWGTGEVTQACFPFSVLYFG